MLADVINGSFEIAGAFFIFMSIKRVYRDKTVRGVHWATTAFFAVWGLWNLYYYPSLDQWVSFAGGVAICISNAIYLSLLIYYMRQERNELDRLLGDAYGAGNRHWGMGEAPEGVLLDPAHIRFNVTRAEARLRQRRGPGL